MSDKNRSKKPTKADQVTAYTVLNHSSLHSADVASRLYSAQDDVVRSEEDILDMQKRIAQLRARVQADNAVIKGLTQVLEARR